MTNERDVNEGAPGADPDVLEDRIANRDLAEQITRIAGGLPPVQRLVFTLRDLQDQSVRETAEILAISEGSVKTNLCLARRAIRLSLERLDGPGGQRR